MTEPNAARSSASVAPSECGVTGHCQDGVHQNCDGTVRSATGWRWFCACTCHPDPNVLPEHKKALDQLGKDRAAWQAIAGRRTGAHGVLEARGR